MPSQFTIDESFIKEVQAQLVETRLQLPQVRSGINPYDPQHTHGGTFARLQIRAGSDKFLAGAGLATKIGQTGTSVDQRLAAFDQRLSGYDQGVDRIIDSSDAIEAANRSYGSFNAFLTGGAATANPTPPR